MSENDTTSAARKPVEKTTDATDRATVHDDEHGELVAIEGRLTVWRVFELAKSFRDRGDDSAATRRFAVAIGDDEINLTIGNFPDEIAQAVREMKARSRYALDDMLGGSHRGLSLDEREALMQSFEDEVDVSDLSSADRGYATFAYTRPHVVHVHPTRRFLYGGGPNRPDAEALETLAQLAVRRLDACVAWLLPTLGVKLALGRPAFSDARSYLVVPGKGALAIPRFTSRATATVTSSGWAELPWEQIGQDLERFGSRANELSGWLDVPSRWLALAKGDEDALRKFLFAYCGIEVLINRAVKRWRVDLVGDLDAALGGAPVVELLWPAVGDENAPNRNLIFRFAATAMLLSRDSAKADTETFSRIAKARNSLAHGSSSDFESLPRMEALSLLDRYLAAAATRLGGVPG
jgi:hypothetical protein